MQTSGSRPASSPRSASISSRGVVGVGERGVDLDLLEIGIGLPDLLKNPPVFTRQANFASQQVVNNGTHASVLARGKSCKVGRTNFWRLMANGWTLERRARQATAIRRWRPWEQSTGPRTLEGKARASRNAYRGGVRRLQREIGRLLNQFDARTTRRTLARPGGRSEQTKKMSLRCPVSSSVGLRPRFEEARLARQSRTACKAPPRAKSAASAAVGGNSSTP